MHPTTLKKYKDIQADYKQMVEKERLHKPYVREVLRGKYYVSNTQLSVILHTKTD